ncbi:hypothetical protein [Kerstersia gyiorum]|uniref:hypothetical protein n=1 Tax=Kerstersia gyiorum TaxID=206506 RepID=UPI00209D7264|nr:hypothetical protein [Kerstersia gyiorum]MCP1680687.1 integrase/recombinase [Kerstersia gyiorum]MCP1825221.1 integrase/recombinase [Kerstersia gyiorum]MCP1828650.1 integrase/recombinase [Kerstersia gyiorum]MCW2452262.1 integrase/recombinase [Kerstersia gyiorum]
MSRFENSYLAESVGYNNGHASGIADGIAAGKKAGFTEGWNAAIKECNPMIEARDREIDRLVGEVRKGNAFIKELRANLEKSQHVSELYHTERDELSARFEQERAKRERLQFLVNLAREHGVNVEDFDR